MYWYSFIGYSVCGLWGWGCVFPKVISTPWSVAALCSSTASSVKLTAVLFPDRTQGFGLLSTLAGANCSIGSEENQDTEVNSNSYFLFFALSCCCTGSSGGGFHFFTPYSRDTAQPIRIYFKFAFWSLKNSLHFFKSLPETVVRGSCHLVAVSLLSFRTRCCFSLISRSGILCKTKTITWRFCLKK